MVAGELAALVVVEIAARLEQPPEALPAPVKADLHRFEAQAERVGDLAILEPLDLTQREDRS